MNKYLEAMGYGGTILSTSEVSPEAMKVKYINDGSGNAATISTIDYEDLYLDCNNHGCEGMKGKTIFPYEEGWTFYTEPLPQLKGVTDSGSAESSYYTWVDQFDTLGLGANVPINTGNASEGLLALKDGEWVVLRVPYPLGFYTKWMDGRIDDPNGGSAGGQRRRQRILSRSVHKRPQKLSRRKAL